MGKNKLLFTALIGTGIAAIGYFTSVPAMIIDAFSIQVNVDELDLFLLRTLSIFIGITLYAVWRKMRFFLSQ